MLFIDRLKTKDLKKQKDGIELRLNAFGEDFSLRMQHTKSILHQNASIITTSGDTITQYKGDHPDCFLTGPIPSHNGSASFSYCDNLVRKNDR